MVKRAMQLWLHAIITLLIVLISEGHPVDITYLESAVAKGAGKNFFQSHYLYTNTLLCILMWETNNIYRQS